MNKTILLIRGGGDSPIPFHFTKNGNGLTSIRSLVHPVTIGQSRGNLHHTLGSLGTIVLQDQWLSLAYGIPDILVIDDISQIVEVNAEVFLASAPD